MGQPISAAKRIDCWTYWTPNDEPSGPIIGKEPSICEIFNPRPSQYLRSALGFAWSETDGS